MSEISKSLFTTISNAGFLIALIVFCILGNGSVLGILARFKKLRTYPNIPIANLALVDLLTALINMPLYLVFSILEVSWFKGKIMAIITLFMARLFMALNLTAMLVLLVNVLLALTCGLRYFTWKTNEKAVAIVFIDWFLCFLLVFLSCSTLFDINLQNAHVLIYRQAYFAQQKTLVISVMTVLVLCLIIFCILVFISLRKMKLQVSLILYHLETPHSFFRLISGGSVGLHHLRNSNEI